MHKNSGISSQPSRAMSDAGSIEEKTVAACAPPSMPGVWWRGDATWRKYSKETYRKILIHAANGAEEFPIGSFLSSTFPDGAPYELNLRRMLQVNKRTGRTRKVKIVPGPEDLNYGVLNSTWAGYFGLLVDEAGEAALTHSQLLQKFVELLCTQDKINSALNKVPVLSPGGSHMMRLRVMGVHISPHLGSEQLLFGRFVKKMGSMYNTLDILDMIGKVHARSIEMLEGKNMYLCYYRTQRSSSPSVLAEDLSTARHAGDSEHIYLDPAAACGASSLALGETVRMVLCLALLRGHGITRMGDAFVSYLAVKDPDFHLPIATLELCKDPLAPPVPTS